MISSGKPMWPPQTRPFLQTRLGDCPRQSRARFANWPQPGQQIVRNGRSNKRSQ